MFRYVFYRNPFHWLQSCSFRCATFTPPRISYPKQQPSFFHFITLRFISFFHSGTCSTLKKTSLHGKKSRQPCRKRLPPAAFHYVPRHLLAAPSLHSQTARASPYTSKKITPFHSANFLLASVGSRLLYLLCFPLRPRTAPDHPPLKKQYNM